jgi:YD repeat-containing protein
MIATIRTPLSRFLQLLLVLAIGVSSLRADRPPHERPPHGKGWYVVVLWEPGTPIEGKKGQYMKDLPEPDLNGLGGKVLHSKNNRRLVELPVAAAEALRKHKSVAYLQRLWMGEPLEELAKSSATTRSSVSTEEDTTLEWGPEAYTYDGSGNIKQFGPDHYTYDTAGRLIQATVTGKTQNFKYDAFGNLVEMAVDGASPVAIPVDPASNRLAGASYDVAGNLVQGRKTYTYDSLNMLIRSGTAQHKLYDVNDEQIAVITQTSSRWTIRDFDGKVLREFTADPSVPYNYRAWTWQSDYIYGEGSLVGGESVKFSSYEDAAIQYGGVRHYHLDHLGSVRMVTNSARRSISQNDFYPFWRERYPDRPGAGQQQRRPDRRNALRRPPALLRLHQHRKHRLPRLHAREVLRPEYGALLIRRSGSG